MDPWEGPDERSQHDEAAPTPGERLLYALGQLFALWYRGELARVKPSDFDIEDLARIIGVWRDVELAIESPFGYSYHFPGEVLDVDNRLPFPWRLVDFATWAELLWRAELDAEA